MLLFSRKLKLSIYTSFWQVFWTVLFAKYWAVSLNHCFYVNVATSIKREEVCKQVGCERERLTLYINHTNFPLINMQQLKHIIFQNLLNEPRNWCYLQYVHLLHCGVNTKQWFSVKDAWLWKFLSFPWMLEFSW